MQHEIDSVQRAQIFIQQATCTSDPYLVDEIFEAALAVERQYQDDIGLPGHVTEVQVQDGVDVGMLKGQEQFQDRASGVGVAFYRAVGTQGYQREEALRLHRCVVNHEPMLVHS